MMTIASTTTAGTERLVTAEEVNNKATSLAEEEAIPNARELLQRDLKAHRMTQPIWLHLHFHKLCRGISTGIPSL